MKAIYYLIVLLVLPASLSWGQQESSYATRLTFEDGLSDDFVYDGLMDYDGLMWFGTKEGLSRYDGSNFHNYLFSVDDTIVGFRGAEVVDLLEDRDSILWIASLRGGLHRYDRDTRSFTKYNFGLEGTITSIMEDIEGRIWGGTFHNGFFEFKKETGNFELFDIGKDAGEDSFRKNSVWQIIEDATDKNILWIGAANAGLFRFDKKSSEFTHFPFYDKGQLHDDLALMTLFMDQPDRIWIGTWGKGLAFFDTGSKKFTFVDQLLSDQRVQPIVVRKIERKKEGALWVAAEDQGLMYFLEEEKIFKLFQTSKDGSSSTRAINLYEDPDGRIWVFNASNSGGDGITVLQPEQGAFNYIPLTESPLCHGSNHRNEAYQITTDLKNQLVMVTTVGCQLLYVYDLNLQLKKVINLPIKNDIYYAYQQFFKPLVLRDGRIIIVGSIKEEHDGCFYELNPLNLDLTPIDQPELNQPRFNNLWIIDIVEDDQGHLWIWTGDQGLWEIDEEGELKIYEDVPSVPVMPFNRQMVLGKKNKLILVMFREGLITIDKQSGLIERIMLEMDKIKIRISSAAQDRNGNIWAGTSHGFWKWDPGSRTWSRPESVTSHIPDNLQVDKVILDQYDNVWITSSKGLYHYDPDEESMTRYYRNNGLSKDVFIDKAFTLDERGIFSLGASAGFYSFNADNFKQEKPKSFVFSSFEILGVDHLVLDMPSTDSAIELTYDQNTFSLSYSTLDYSGRDDYRYAYRLTPTNESWIDLGNRKELVFHDLPPGNYQLAFRNATPSGKWNDEVQSMSIQIWPPWWGTWWAYLTYLIAGGIIVYKIVELNRRTKRVRIESEKEREMHHLKLNFYTNITHDFLTPLTVISGISDGLEDEAKREIIKRNTGSLLDLVNQILDLRKLEANVLLLNLTQGNLVDYLEYLTESFQPLAKENGIKMQFYGSEPEIWMDFDREQIRLIFSNLMSNALKFTGVGGKIYVSVERENAVCKWMVRDTGVGISREDMGKIFDRFYQGDTAGDQNGSGIGLAYVKELVQLMGGQIDVKSERSSGSGFYISLPITNEKILRETPAKAVAFRDSNSETEKDLAAGVETISTLRKTILIVEDNPDVSYYTANCLRNEYEVIQAFDGQDGIEQAIETIPDLILTDVIMPKKNGYEVCDILKANPLTSHIPIVMLTAKASEVAKLEGLRHRVDAYLTKPFNEEELTLRISNLLHQQKLWQRIFKSSQFKSPEPKDDPESQFIANAKQVILDNLQKADYGVEMYCRDLLISRSQLHRKLKALTDQSATQFINTVKLERAKELLHAGSLNVSEIAYESGFESPSYFTRLYTEKYGRPPSTHLD